MRSTKRGNIASPWHYDATFQVRALIPRSAMAGLSARLHVPLQVRATMIMPSDCRWRAGEGGAAESCRIAAVGNTVLEERLNEG